MFYSAQVWGFKHFEQVEKLFRFFVKKMLFLPSNTPNYMLHLETGLHSQFIQTLRLHFAYIRKTLNLPRYRLTRIFAEEIIAKNIYWAREWYELCDNLGIALNSNILDMNLSDLHLDILETLKRTEHEMNINSARGSQFHDAYPHLKFDIKPYFIDENPAHLVSLVLRTRGGLLNINARAFKRDTIGICTICNLDEAENTYHLICRCPVFMNARKICFGNTVLSISELYEILNGNNFTSLYSFLNYCLKYRELILNEFN